MIDPLATTRTGAPESRNAQRGSPLQSRFTPGTVLADRFRIVMLAGHGGMAEVYRADDLKLGESVALKFVSAQIAMQPDALQRLHREVRLGRQVSHPNVCRLHDIFEWNGQHFISMQFIDGEDLASLLRRIGRLPHDKAVDVTRDVSAGLAALHAHGVVHRDLKPANIMIDGRGTARITDFGVADLAVDLAAIRERSGTPAYMAPEQLLTGVTTQKSDLYAFGLIVYEMFTGKRRFDARSEQELIAQHASAAAHVVHEETRALDSDIQRIVVQCLKELPEARPSSIDAVIAALPPRDQLQAVVDRGETPSPEMVAAAGQLGYLTPAPAIAALAVLLAALAGIAGLSSRTTLYGVAPVSLSPGSLADRANEILRSAGVERAQSVATLVRHNDEFLAHVARTDSSLDRWQRLRTGRPGAVEFVYRQSPDILVPSATGRVTPTDPPPTLPGMAEVRLDATGALVRFRAVPDLSRPAGQGAPVRWERFFDFAGLEMAAFAAAEPLWLVDVASDDRMAWTGTAPDYPSEPVRVEAASRGGAPVSFAVVGAWQTSLADQGAARVIGNPENPIPLAAMILRIVVLGIAVVLARRNLRRGRSDRQGALRTAVVLFVILFVGRVLGMDHVADLAAEINLLFYGALPIALTESFTTWLVYLAVEPYVRRFWPQALISWVRLLAGRVRDPRVGRDVLFGLIGGLIIALLSVSAVIAPTWFGGPPLTPLSGSAASLGELPVFLSSFLMGAAESLRIGVGVI